MLDHILIVDKRRLVREALAKILLSCGISKAAIACIENVEDALEYAQYTAISLLICSDDLFEHNCFDFRAELVKITNVKQLPLMVLSQQRNDKNNAATNSEKSNLRHSIVLQAPFKKHNIINALFDLTHAAIFTSQINQTPDSYIHPTQDEIQLLVEPKPTILVVDDESSNIDVVAGNLSNIYRVIAAKSGEHALKIVASNMHNITLILLDVMMPEMDGYQVCIKLKENNISAKIPIIFLSAKTMVDDIKYGFDLGAVDYITKPLNGDLLRARVATHISLHQQNLALSAQIMTLEENVKLREDIENITHHDLKAPLSNILFETYRLTDKKAAKSINRAVNNVVNMINNSLNLYKIEQGIYRFSPEATNINFLVNDAINAVQNLSREKRINFDLYGFDSEHLILAEPLLCLSIFNNLIKNAVEASPSDQTVVIKLVNEGKKISFQSINQGVIPENIRSRLFDKYSSSNYRLGTGLGTYSAKLMTQVQNGEISFETIEKLKTQFTIKFPAA